jgi:hypothetical protein
MSPTTFPVLILNARPGAGKSEIIDYLLKIPTLVRHERFHISTCEIFDDFPILWSWFEEDALLSKMGYPRLHTTEDGYFKDSYLWHLLIQRLCQEYDKRLRDIADYQSMYTAIVEFSRGTEHGGYLEAYQHLSPSILKNAAILYINVSWEESLRKNRVRYNPDKPDSILEHGLDDEKMNNLYRYDDWLASFGDKKYITLNGISVPCAVFDNEDDVTTKRGKELEHRLSKVLNKLWKRYQSIHEPDSIT